MPIVNSNFKAHFRFRSGFISTVYSGLIRRLKINQSENVSLLEMMILLIWIGVTVRLLQNQSLFSFMVWKGMGNGLILQVRHCILMNNNMMQFVLIFAVVAGS